MKEKVYETKNGRINLVGRSPGFGNSSDSKLQKKVWDKEIEYWKSLLERDFETYSNLWHSDFRGWPDELSFPGEKKEVVGLAKTQAEKMKGLKIQVDLMPFYVHPVEDQVTTLYKYTLSNLKPFNMKINTNRVIHNWKEIEGEYKIISGMSSNEYYNSLAKAFSFFRNAF